MSIEDINDIKDIDKIVVNEEGREVVELEIEEYQALSEALHLYQKENSLLEVHVSQLQDHIEKLEDELAVMRIKSQNNKVNRLKIAEKYSVV